ncbi:MAG: hemerythrin domain-containing protein [Acidobacteriota bacterium]
MVQIGEKAATLDAPLEHLIACHRRIEGRLATLEQAAGEFAADPEKALAAIHACLHFMDSNGALHTEDEEQSVFPRLRPMLLPEELVYIDSLEHQHRAADTLYAELKARVSSLRESGGKASEGQIGAYLELAGQLRQFYREHIRSEEEVLFPLAHRSLPGDELRHISGEMKQRRAALSNPAVQRTPCPTA